MSPRSGLEKAAEIEPSFKLAVQWQNMLEESFTQHLVTLKSCSAQQQNSVKACKEQLEEHFSDVQTALASHGHSLEEMASTQERQLSDQSEAVTKWSRDQNKLVDQVNTRVTQFLQEDLKDDLATGTTPQKRPFDYPSKLIRTEPHEVLRERFRASYVAPPYSPEPQPIKSVSSEDSVLVFELSGISTASSESGVYSLRSSEGEGDGPDNNSLDEVILATDEAAFAEPQPVVKRQKLDVSQHAETQTERRDSNKRQSLKNSKPDLSWKHASINQF